MTREEELEAFSQNTRGDDLAVICNALYAFIHELEIRHDLFKTIGTEESVLRALELRKIIKKELTHRSRDEDTSMCNKCKTKENGIYHIVTMECTLCTNCMIKLITRYFRGK